MFELLVPPEKVQLDRLKADKKSYHLETPAPSPDVCKVKDLDRREDCETIVATRAGGRDNVGCIVLGRGEDDRNVLEWLGIAASVPSFIGFADGRTVSGIRWSPFGSSTRGATRLPLRSRVAIASSLICPTTASFITRPILSGPTRT
jgi:hypothetical protein